MWLKKRPEHNRSSIRYDVNWPARAMQKGRPFFVRIKNISAGGMLLTIPQRQHTLEDIPCVVVVRFRGTTAEFPGDLVYYRFSSEEQCFGFQFGKLPDRAQVVLDAWLELLKDDPAATGYHRNSLFQRVANWFRRF